MKEEWDIDLKVSPIEQLNVMVISIFNLSYSMGETLRLISHSSFIIGLPLLRVNQNMPTS